MMPSSKARTLNLLGLGVMLSLVGDTAIYIVLPTHTVEAGILLVDVGLMLSANRLIRIFINSPYGYLIERWPRRRVLIASQLIGALANLLYLFPGFWPMLAGRLLWGVAWSGIWIGSNTAVLDIATRADRGRLVGRHHMSGFAGFIGGALAGGLLTDAFGYHVTFLFAAITSLAAGLVWAFFLPETRPEVVPDHTTHHPGAALPNVVTHRAGLLTAVVLMGLNWLIFLGIIGAVLSLLLQERIGTALALGALIIPIATLTGVIAAARDTVSFAAAPLSGWLSDRLGNRWTLIIGALALGILALVLVAGGTDMMVIFGILLGAISTSILQTQVTALAGDYALENRQGRILGVFNTVGDIGSAGGPLLAFALINPAGLNRSLADVFLLSAALLVLMLPVTVLVAWRERSTQVTLDHVRPVSENDI